MLGARSTRLFAACILTRLSHLCLCRAACCGCRWISGHAVGVVACTLLHFSGPHDRGLEGCVDQDRRGGRQVQAALCHARHGLMLLICHECVSLNSEAPAFFCWRGVGALQATTMWLRVASIHLVSAYHPSIIFWLHPIQAHLSACAVHKACTP